MFGLIISDPSQNTARRAALSARLYELDLPLSGCTEDAASLFPADMPRNAFLRAASAALLQPGQPLPLEGLMSHLQGPDPLPANVLRKYLFLQASLLPYLRPGRRVLPLDGCFLVGDALLVAPVSPEDTVDAVLPPGVWTELNGTCHEGRLRCMRGYNELPVLVRENTLLPVSINGQSLTQTTDDDADRLTLHWFQPKDSAECVLADGTRYHVQCEGERVSVRTNTDKAFHLILHRNGAERLIR